MIRYAVASLLLVSAIAVSAAQSDMGPPRWAANIARKQIVIMRGVPAPYTAARDPTRDTSAKLSRGRVVFERHCSSCHGWNGQGAGPEAFALVPAPADLEWLSGSPKAKAEPYMYWTIAEGGRVVESEMPTFKTTLPRRDIWAVIAYVRAGLPKSSP